VGQQKANSYNYDDLNLLSTLANHAAISIINAQLYEKTHNLATTDGLTGLYTHRTYQEKLEEEIQKAKRYRTNLALIMVDTDHFKEYNDTYGHPEGDILLKDICKLLKSYVRKTDIVCRYGGDEFTIILADLDKKKAIDKAKTIREAIQLRFNQREVKITASLGVACFPEDAKSKQEILTKVDELLYTSKRGGRNKVTFLE
jgi:diguanylate cyclase (GGDEF)-like protein